MEGGLSWVAESKRVRVEEAVTLGISTFQAVSMVRRVVLRPADSLTRLRLFFRAISTASSRLRGVAVRVGNGKIFSYKLINFRPVQGQILGKGAGNYKREENGYDNYPVMQKRHFILLIKDLLHRGRRVCKDCAIVLYDLLLLPQRGWMSS